LCSGVCVGKISEKEYKKIIRKTLLFLRNGKAKVIEAIESEIKGLTSKLQFEEAEVLREKLESLKYITKPTRVLEDFEQNIEGVKEEELEEVVKVLGMGKKPKRIECYDISNIGRMYATGSMVVFVDGAAEKSEYRRFKIKTVSGVNDTAMIYEVLVRRFNNDWPNPDLIVVDGGKGQLNASMKALTHFNLDTKIISLAKRLEEIYLPGAEKPVRLSRESRALKLLQRIRDEAHRFAIDYHRKLRKRAFLTTQ
jgi:excinuclease ABC subunit C